MSLPGAEASDSYPVPDAARARRKGEVTAATHLKVELHDNGPALWPEYIPITDLDETHRDLGTPLFETMYQGRRGGLAGQIIKPEWFRYYHGSPPGQTYAFVDVAISQKTTADETAIVVANVSIEHTLSPGLDWEVGDPAPLKGTVFYRWVWHGRVGLKDQERIIAEAANYYRPVAIGIEAVAYQTALVQLIESDHPELPIEPVTPDRDKLSRHLALARLYEFGRAYHHPTMEASAYEWQLSRLPNGRHDDMADAASGILQMTGLLTGAITVNQRPPGFL